MEYTTRITNVMNRIRHFGKEMEMHEAVATAICEEIDRLEERICSPPEAVVDKEPEE